MRHGNAARSSMKCMTRATNMLIAALAPRECRPGSIASSRAFEQAHTNAHSAMPRLPPSASTQGAPRPPFPPLPPPCSPCAGPRGERGCYAGLLAAPRTPMSARGRRRCSLCDRSLPRPCQISPLALPSHLVVPTPPTDEVWGFLLIFPPYLDHPFEFKRKNKNSRGRPRKTIIFHACRSYCRSHARARLPYAESPVSWAGCTFHAIRATMAGTVPCLHVQ